LITTQKYMINLTNLAQLSGIGRVESKF